MNSHHHPLDTLFYAAGAPLLLLAGLCLLREPGMAQTGDSAAGSLRELRSIEATFKTSFSGTNEYWVGDLAGLYYRKMPDSGQLPIRMIEYLVCLADAAPLPSSVAGAIPPHVGAPKSGYWFKALPIEGAAKGRHPEHYAFAAFPAQYGSSARLTFILNEEGTIYKKDLGGRVIVAWPSDPLREGWSSMD